MVIEIKWCGIDYGETLMSADALRNFLMLGDICRELGRPELIADRVRKYRILKEKYGSYPKVHEGHRNEIYDFVLDRNSEAMNLFARKEQEFLDRGEGAKNALSYLKGEGIEVYVISEMKKSLEPLGKDHITRFLKRQGLIEYLEGLITPLGKIHFKTGAVDMRYRGFTKQEGSIYDILAQELSERGIQPDEAVMVGDRPNMDINPAHERGFRTIQYTGYTDLGKSEADVVIKSFKELSTILAKKS